MKERLECFAIMHAAVPVAAQTIHFPSVRLLPHSKDVGVNVLHQKDRQQCDRSLWWPSRCTKLIRVLVNNVQRHIVLEM